MDTGLDDGKILPWLVVADDNPVAAPVPRRPEYMSMTIVPRLKKWPLRALPDANPKTVEIDVATDLGRILELLRQDVRRELGENADRVD